MNVSIFEGRRWFHDWVWLGVALVLGLALARLPLVVAGGLVGATAVAILIAIQPLVALGLTLLAGPLGAWESLFVNLGPLDSGQILLMLTILAWLARGLRDRRVVVPQPWLSVPLLLFTFVMGLTLLDAPSLDYGLRELLKWVEIWLVMVLVVDMVPLAQRGWLVALLLAAGVSQGLLGIYQFGLRGDGPDHFLVLGRFYRAYGTFVQPNPFGGFMNLSALLGLGTATGLAIAWWQRRRPFTLVWLGLVTVATAVTTLGLVVSWSRGAWLGFAAGTAVFLLFLPRRLRWGGVVVAVALLLGLVAWQANLVPTAVADRVIGFADDFTFGDVRGVDINDANYAVLERLAHWQAALDMARDNLWLGVGFGNYEPAYGDYDLINWPYPLGHAHNYYLNLLAETGIVGLMAYLLLWTAVFTQSIRVVQKATWPDRGIALGLLAAWTALSVHHLVDKLYVNNIYIHLGVMFGLLQLLNGRWQALTMTNEDAEA